MRRRGPQRLRCGGVRGGAGIRRAHCGGEGARGEPEGDAIHGGGGAGAGQGHLPPVNVPPIAQPWSDCRTSEPQPPPASPTKGNGDATVPFVCVSSGHGETVEAGRRAVARILYPLFLRQVIEPLISVFFLVSIVSV